VGKLVRRGSNAFNDYFAKLQKESQETGNDPSYLGKVYLGPENDFNPGWGINFQIASGSDFSKIVLNLPDYYSTSPMTYSVEIGLKDPEQGPMIVSRLSEIKDMVLEMVPDLKQLVVMGLDIHFRNVSNNIVADFGLSGSFITMSQQTLPPELKNVDFAKSSKAFTGSSQVNITSGWTPMMLLNKSLEEIIRAACNLKIDISGEFSQSKIFFSILSTFMIGAITKGNVQNIQQYNVIIKFLEKIIASIRNYKFCLKYDDSVLYNFFASLVNTENPNHFANLTENFKLQQVEFNQFVEMGKGFVSFVADYLDILRNINFEKI